MTPLSDDHYSFTVHINDDRASFHMGASILRDGTCKAGEGGLKIIEEARKRLDAIEAEIRDIAAPERAQTAGTE